ncbi:MAG: hypothetical protein AB1407_03105 [Spirochaetota bacterium]
MSRLGRRILRRLSQGILRRPGFGGSGWLRRDLTLRRCFRLKRRIRLKRRVGKRREFLSIVRQGLAKRGRTCKAVGIVPLAPGRRGGDQ